MPIDENASQDEQLTDEKMDELVAQSEESPNTDIPMEKEETAPPVDPKAEAQAEMYEFVHNGKTIQAPRDQMIKWAQMGYNYPQRAQQLNQQLQQWEQQKSAWEKDWGVYKQVDQWAKQNPDQWQRIQQGLEAPEPQAPQHDPYASKFKQLESKLSATEQFIQAQMAEKQQATRAQEDQKLNQEITSIRDQYKDLEWDTPDQDGKSLEHRVLEHAEKLGIPSFDAAFKHLLHDQLVARAQNFGKQTVAKNIQQQTRMGVLGKSPTPATKGFSQPKDIQNQSYESLLQEALSELGMGA